jgi:hypothetical protein
MNGFTDPSVTSASSTKLATLFWAFPTGDLSSSSTVMIMVRVAQAWSGMTTREWENSPAFAQMCAHVTRTIGAWLILLRGMEIHFRANPNRGDVCCKIMTPALRGLHKYGYSPGKREKATLTVVRSGWCRGKLLGTLTPIWTLSNHTAVRQRALWT